MSKIIDLQGKVFEKLTVREFSHTKSNQNYWICDCECGNTKIASAHHLTIGKTKSCRCHMKNYDSKTSRLYQIWTQMKSRCHNKNSANYRNYGMKGIQVCERWHDYKKFHEDMANSHDKHVEQYGKVNRTLERTNNSKGYSPDNCKWATKKEQRRNCSQSKFYQYRGKTVTTGEISELYGISYGTIESRLHRGWSIDKIIETPVAKQIGGRKRNVYLQSSS